MTGVQTCALPISGVLAIGLQAVAQGDPPRAFNAETAATRAPATTVRIDLIGDSTQTNNAGYGRGFCANLTPAVDCLNMSRGGASTKTYREMGLWDKALATKPDYMLIQFGHNDSGPLDDKDRARGSINGVGAESKEIDNPVRHVHETVYTFGHYLEQYIKDARAHGATPILCSLVPRKIWKDGKIERQTDTYRRQWRTNW